MKMNNEIVVDGVTYVKKEVEVKYWEGTQRNRRLLYS